MNSLNETRFRIESVKIPFYKIDICDREEQEKSFYRASTGVVL